MGIGLSKEEFKSEEESKSNSNGRKVDIFEAFKKRNEKIKEEGLPGVDDHVKREEQKEEVPDLTDEFFERYGS